MQAKTIDSQGEIRHYRKRGYQSRTELVDLAYARIGKKAQGQRFRQLIFTADVLVGSTYMFAPPRVAEIVEFIADQQGFNLGLARKFITGKFRPARRR